MIVIFVLGYIAIVLEHPLKIDKAASALIIGGLGWALYSFTGVSQEELSYEIKHHLVDIAEILFFLLGAMTIVELIDAHEGFSIITDKITTNKKVTLMWILSAITFFFSAALDNLTTAIVMSALLTKLIKDKDDLWMFAGIIILSANAGGAWSPIGDVTTIMLWVGGQVTTKNIIVFVFLPSLICALAPLIYLSFKLKGEITRPASIKQNIEHIDDPTTPFERNLIFYIGVGGLLFVPIFKSQTHLPPYVGMLLSLGVLWVITEVLHRSKNQAYKAKRGVFGVLKKVDTPTIFFFLGILLAVASLQSAGQLDIVANYLDRTFNSNIYIINTIIGLLSSIVDNVPLVAGAIGMYPVVPDISQLLTYESLSLIQTLNFEELSLLTSENNILSSDIIDKLKYLDREEFQIIKNIEPSSLSMISNFNVDGKFWQFLAYCAGTGGSVLIIGSAAGVAVMGILKMDFIWYVKNISLLALIGYLAGALTYYLQMEIFLQ